MASITSRRLANSLSWTLNLTSRSRSFAFSYTQADRSNRHSRRPMQNNRHFTYSSFRAAEAEGSIAEAPVKARYTVGRESAPGYASSRAKQHEEPPPTARNELAQSQAEPIREYSHGLADAPPDAAPGNEEGIDWTRSFSGLSQTPFSKEASDILMQPIAKDDIEVKPDGVIYLPEIKYRRILNQAFGPGGWGLAPRGETIVTSKSVTREYALLAHGRLVSIARGEQDYFDPEGIPTATEGCKSNALRRCCKDLGVASELWDPRYVRKFMAENAKEVWVEHTVTKKKKKIFLRKDDQVKYPFKVSGA